MDAKLERFLKQICLEDIYIDKLKDDTGFIPDYTFEEGIIRTINWYKNKE